MCEQFSLKDKKFFEINFSGFNGKIFFTPAQALLNPEVFRVFCIQLLEKLNLEKDASTSRIYIVTCFEQYIKVPTREVLVDIIKTKFHHLSVFFNSNISIRLIDFKKDENNVLDFIKNEINKYDSNDLLYCDVFKKNESNIIEYLDLHLRLQKENYLKKTYTGTGAHGKNITPFIYSNECECLESLQKINSSGNSKLKRPEIELYNEASYNILLVDDKKEKGELIKYLLGEYSLKKDCSTHTVWNNKNVSHKFFNEERIKNNKTELDLKNKDHIIDFIKEVSGFISGNREKVNIFQVHSIQEVKYLLSIDSIKIDERNEPLRFDLVMMDYLLAEDKKGDREYFTEFFSWFIEKKDDTNTCEWLSCQENPNKNKTNNDIIDAIKNNRGPLQKLWFFPITAFNQTMLDELRNKGVRLIDYYWHISRGADPINTPNQFLSVLNNFLYLQLQQAVYNLETLVTFLNKTIQKFEKDMSFEDFQALMGSEYIVLLQKHGWRAVIKRDAVAGSAFSQYIWKEFYSNSDNRYLFRLIDKIEKFYHTCAYADKNDYDKMMLFLKELEIFITDYWTSLQHNFAEVILKSTRSCTSAGIKINEINKILNERKISKPELAKFKDCIIKVLK